jgi:hypothetical protein
MQDLTFELELSRFDAAPLTAFIVTKEVCFAGVAAQRVKFYLFSLLLINAACRSMDTGQ